MKTIPQRRTQPHAATRARGCHCAAVAAAASGRGDTFADGTKSRELLGTVSSLSSPQAAPDTSTFDGQHGILGMLHTPRRCPGDSPSPSCSGIGKGWSHAITPVPRQPASTCRFELPTTRNAPRRLRLRSPGRADLPPGIEPRTTHLPENTRRHPLGQRCAANVAAPGLALRKPRENPKGPHALVLLCLLCRQPRRLALELSRGGGQDTAASPHEHPQQWLVRAAVAVVQIRPQLLHAKRSRVGRTVSVQGADVGTSQHGCTGGASALCGASDGQRRR